MWNIVAFVFDLADKNSRPSLYLFSDQNGAKNPTFWGGTYPYGLYKEVPPRLPRTNFISWNLESVSYFGTSEHFSGKKKKKNLKDQDLYRETGMLS